MRVSVIVPAYNAEETIAETLDSLCAQTFQDWEAVVIDDGSTDQTATVVTHFVERDNRVRYVAQPHFGGSVARNKGIELAKSDWLLFLDADDWILPEHLERLTVALTSDPDLDAVHCGWTRVDGKGGFGPAKCAPPLEDLFPAFAETCAFQPNTCIVRRSLVEAVGYFDTSLFNCQDWDLWQRIARTGSRFGAVPEILARHRTRPGSLSHQVFQLLENGLRVIVQGHSPDLRVANPKPEHAHGMPKTNLSRARLYFVCWPAGIALGAGQDPCPLLNTIEDDREPRLNPSRVADLLFEAALLPSALPVNGWDHLWPKIGQQVARFLERLEQISGTVELARFALQRLEKLILDHSELRPPLTIGTTHVVQVDVSQPIPDIVPPVAVERLHCEVLMEGEVLGRIELPASSDLVTSADVVDAIATEYAWPILCQFFKHTLYSSLRIEREPNTLSLWRGPLCLSAEVPATEHISWSAVHEQVGWPLLLQELWSRPEWPNEKFYDTQHSEAPTPCAYFADGQFNVEISEELSDVVTHHQKLNITLTVGGMLLGCVIVPAKQNFVRAQEIRVALTVMGGFNLCRLAVRQGLIGKQLTDPASLQTRLAAAAKQHHPVEAE